MESAMKVDVKLQKASHAVSEYLMGHNLEMYPGGACGVLTDRLENPKFLGPADVMSGSPPGWSITPFYGKSAPGMGMASGDAIMLEKRNGANVILHQAERRIYKGEMLEVELWAKAWHAPVAMEIMLKPTIMRHPAYVSGKITVDSSYWKQYKLEFKIPADDANAVFQIMMESEGMVFLDQVHLRPAGQSHVDKTATDAFKTIGITALRFPGGSISTVYHWKNGTGPIHLRPVHHDPQFNTKVIYDFGIEEYLELCIEQNITPQITVNIGSGTPEEAAAFASYCREFYINRGIKPPVAFFQMGNEQFAAHESAHMTGEMYVGALRDYVPAVRKAYPESRIIAVGYPYSGEFGSQERTVWRTLILDKVPELFDLISNHYYKGQWRETFTEQQKNAVDSIGKIRDDLLKMVDDVKQRKLKTKIALTEWNYWLYSNAYCRQQPDEGFEPMDPIHCLYTAGMFHMMAELGEHVELSNYYHLLNGMGVFTNFAGRFHESPVAAVFRFYRPAFPGKFIPVKNNSPEYAGGISTVSGIGIETPIEKWLFMINFDPENTYQLKLPPEFQKAVKEILYFKDMRKGIESPALIKRSNSETLTLPPMSICRSVLNK